MFDKITFVFMRRNLRLASCRPNESPFPEGIARSIAAEALGDDGGGYV